MEIVTPILGGLGLFFVGIRGVGASLQQLVGRRMRAVLRRAMAAVWSSAAIGATLGALTQSSNAVAFIVTGMLGAGLVPLAGAVTVVIWSNIGTAGLVLLASVDLRIAALWLLGIVGTAIFFRLDAKGRLRPALEGLFALGLLFLGLVLVRTGAAPLQELDMVRELMGGAGG
ncbi:MAG: Na/Pi cotransporter family protein, partial [Acetobacteraceae bacterium]|nr:Na/Pi cotransporter family protein [Acetobacteraceae bacterium]